MNIESLKQKFAAKYGRPAEHIVRAPGRVNLIGEHTDYNDGFVLPIAIENCTLAALAVRNDRLLKLSSAQADVDAEIDLNAPIEPGQPKWVNYSRGVAAGLLGAGIELRGADIFFESDVPLGGGLSSSAALDVSTAMALLVAADKVGVIGLYDLARICQLGDHKFAGTPCGIMDQAISAMGQAGRALLLDCRDGSTEMIPFNDPSMVLLVIDTEVKHELNDGGYASRRAQCESAAAKMGIASLRYADDALLQTNRDTLTDKEFMRSRHVIGEIARTLEAVTALKAGDYHRFGRLMYGSHESLRDDYEVSCEELDAVVELARPLKGVYGARMTGGGFGGSAIILAEAVHADAISQAVSKGFEKQFGRRCPVIVTHAADGAGILE